MCVAESGKPSTPGAGAGAAPACPGAAGCRKVVKITAKLPVTLSARGNDSIAPPMTHHEFSSTSNDKTFAGNTPTVLIRNCNDIELIAETVPPNQADVAWAVVPNPGPGAPALASGSGLKNSLKTNSAGGYSISASLDGTTVYWNLVLVEIKVTSSTITRNSGNFTNRSGGGNVGASSGVFNVGDASVCAMHGSANIEVTAGGEATLDTYCDKVTVGMVNILQNDTAAADYAGGGQERERINKVSGLASPVVDPAVVVTDLGYPILDRGGASGTRATGGSTIFLSHTRSTPATGKARLVETCDSPAVGFHALLPEFGKAATKRATAIKGVNDFSLHLVAYSSDADYSYVTWGTAPWVADYSGAVTFSAAGVPKWTKGAAAGVTGAGATFTLIADGKESKAAGTEVRPPVFLDYILDAR